MVSGIGSSLICFSSSAGKMFVVVLGVRGRRVSISAWSSAEISTVSAIGIGGGFGLVLESEVEAKELNERMLICNEAARVELLHRTALKAVGFVIVEYWMCARMSTVTNVDVDCRIADMSFFRVSFPFHIYTCPF